jgi:nucleotide-binding universal stress UspA family protein
VHAHVVPGHADKVVQAAAREHAASLVVVGAIGHRGNESRRLGTRADRTAQESQVPVLTIRDSAGFVEWFKGARSLRVVLGIDACESADNAARWLDELCRAGAVEVVLAHLYWPPEAFYRLGLGGTRSLVEPDAELVKPLERQFSERFDAVLHAKQRTYRIEPHLGRLGDGLAGLAGETRADLLVVGCRAQGALQRLWEGSIARQALHAASTSVAFVPAPATAPPLHIPRLRHVLVATDFSELGNAAIPLAYAAGGTVHLLHVVKAGRIRVDQYDVFQPAADETTAEAAAAARARLSRLIPPDVSAKHATSEVLVLAADDAGQAICQAAERLGVDLITLGTHGRTGLARAALGSVAAHVLANTRRPLLMARNPKP